MLEANGRLLASVVEQDWESYVGLCAPNMTCFEPESRGLIVEGLNFHRYYFNLERAPYAGQNTVVSPRVKLLGKNMDSAIVSYVRLLQNGTETRRFEETRVWEMHESRVGGEKWKHIHFHRSETL